MSKLGRFIPVALLLLYLVIKAVPYIKLPDGGSDDTPSRAEQAMLEPISLIIKDYPEAAAQFNSMYNGMAVVVESDRVILKTTGDVRLAHENAGAIAVQVGQIPRIVGYTEAVDEYLSSQIGTDNVPLDTEIRLRIVNAFRGLAWATNQ